MGVSWTSSETPGTPRKVLPTPAKIRIIIGIHESRLKSLKEFLETHKKPSETIRTCYSELTSIVSAYLVGTMESNWTEVVEQFNQMNLREPLLRGIDGYGFDRPSAIQQHAIKPCILGTLYFLV
jgi:hypothetical protein